MSDEETTSFEYLNFRILTGEVDDSGYEYHFGIEKTTSNSLKFTLCHYFIYKDPDNRVNAYSSDGVNDSQFERFVFLKWDQFLKRDLSKQTIGKSTARMVFRYPKGTQDQQKCPSDKKLMEYFDAILQRADLKFTQKDLEYILSNKMPEIEHFVQELHTPEEVL